jgi:hypothetical protein
VHTDRANEHEFLVQLVLQVRVGVGEDGRDLCQRRQALLIERALSDINEAGTVMSGEPLGHIVEESVGGEFQRMRRRVNRLEARLYVFRQGEAEVANGVFPGNCAQDVGWDGLHMMGDRQEAGVDRRERGLVALMVGNRQGEPFEQVLYQGCLLPMDLIEDDFLQVILHCEIGVVVAVFDQVRHRRQDRHDAQVAPLVSVDGPTTSLSTQNERIRLAEHLVAELVEHGQQEEDLVDSYDVAGYHHRDGVDLDPVHAQIVQAMRRQPNA